MTGILEIPILAGTMTVGQAAAGAAALIGTAGTVASGISASNAQMGAAAQQQAIANSQAQWQQRQAAMARQQASDERAIAQRASMEHLRRGRLASSRATAVAAASGAGAADPTVVDVLSGISGEAEYQAASSMYEGETKARALEEQALGRDYSAQMTRAEGAMAAQTAKRAAARSLYGGYFGAGQTMLSAGAGLYEKYGYKPKRYGEGDYGFAG